MHTHMSPICRIIIIIIIINFPIPNNPPLLLLMHHCIQQSRLRRVFFYLYIQHVVKRVLSIEMMMCRMGDDILRPVVRFLKADLDVA